MPKLKLELFSGAVPRTSNTELKDNEARTANNVKLYSGELRAWRGPTAQTATVVANAQSIFRLRNPSLSQYAWLTWTGDVDAVTGMLSDTSDFRLYYTGDGVPKKTNWSLATTGSGPLPIAWYNMGVPAPAAAPTTTLTAGGSAPGTDTRNYVYTYVSTFGSITEESAPSPSSSNLTVTAGYKVTINGFSAAPTSNYNITAIRIYRSSGGVYSFVAQIAIGTASYVDDNLAAALGGALSTIGWIPPPSNMIGLISIANGMMSGFVENTVYFCVPYSPHAWPLAYAQTLPHRVVGMGAYGNSLVVMTEGFAHIMTGVTPDAITVEKVPLPQPCVAKRSIASDGFGVVYAGADGLVGIGNSVRGIVTNNLFRRDEWRAYSPTTLIGGIYDSKYIGAFQSSSFGNEAMVISRDDIPALTFLTMKPRDIFVDPQESSLYYLNDLDGVIYKFDDDANNPAQYEWKSKRFVLPQGVTWSVVKVDADIAQMGDATAYNNKRNAIIAANTPLFSSPLLGDLNDTALNVYPINGSTQTAVPSTGTFGVINVFFYSEGDTLELSLPITSWDPQRLSPFKSREITVSAVGTINVRSITLATTVGELRE